MFYTVPPSLRTYPFNLEDLFTFTTTFQSSNLPLLMEGIERIPMSPTGSSDISILTEIVHLLQTALESPEEFIEEVPIWQRGEYSKPEQENLKVIFPTYTFNLAHSTQLYVQPPTPDRPYNPFFSRISMSAHVNSIPSRDNKVILLTWPSTNRPHRRRGGLNRVPLNSAIPHPSNPYPHYLYASLQNLYKLCKHFNNTRKNLKIVPVNNHICKHCNSFFLLFQICHYDPEDQAPPRSNLVKLFCAAQAGPSSLEHRYTTHSHVIQMFFPVPPSPRSYLFNLEDLLTFSTMFQPYNLPLLMDGIERIFPSHLPAPQTSPSSPI